MMDDMDRLLRALPAESPSPELASLIRAAVLRRHRRRLAIRRSIASVCGLLGFWLAWPGLIWLSSGQMYVSSASWLIGGLGYVSTASVDSLWNAAFSVQDAMGSSLLLSIWLGALLLCCAIFLALDSAAWQPTWPPAARGRTSGMLASSLHT